MRRLALAFALLAAGCPGPRAGATQTPEAALARYLDALSRDRLDEAWSLLSTEYRRTHDRAAFERALASADRKAAGSLRGARVQVEAEVELPDGERLPLVLEGGAWRFARDPLDFYPQKSPREALRSFIRAVEGKRWEVVYRFVPARYRAGITVAKLRDRWEGEKREELAQELERVKAHLGEPLQLSPAGDEATLAIPEAGERKQARLVLEDGLWRVDALE